MENNKPDYTYDSVFQIDDSQTASKKYLAKVFSWMFLALGISAFVAFEFYLNKSLWGLLINPGVGLSGLGYVAIFAPVAFSFVISFGFNRISYPALLILFIAYAVSIGISLSFLGFMYTGASIFGVFLSSALVFGIMAVAGYITDMDLSKFGSILVMIFFGAFAVGMVNFFLHSEQLEYIISFVFVALMIGLTAYYMQMLKRIGEGIEYGSNESKKLVLIGAFVLYTTFINLFMSMMRIFGRRN